MNDLERAIERMEASLGRVDDIYDDNYNARHFPWHEPGPRCAGLPAHTHTVSRKVWYWPKPVEVWPP
jgi:hypothetical protein